MECVNRNTHRRQVDVVAIGERTADEGQVRIRSPERADQLDEGGRGHRRGQSSISSNELNVEVGGRGRIERGLLGSLAIHAEVQRGETRKIQSTACSGEVDLKVDIDTWSLQGDVTREEKS